MSYILDALRRADAERERGAVPGLQSQQNAIAEDDAASTRPRRLVWAVGALALALVAALAWAFLGGASSTSRPPIEGSVVPAPLPVLPSAQEPMPTAAGAATAPSTGTTPVPSTARTVVPPAAPAIAPRIETRVVPAPAPLPAARPAPAATGEPRQVAPAAAVPAERSSARSTAEARRAPQRGTDASASTASTAAPNAGAARVYTPAELPEEIRRDLPKVVIGGSSYSGDAASRMIMVNGQVFHEGDRLAPGLVLERIRQKSAVLSFKGWQYEVMF